MTTIAIKDCIVASDMLMACSFKIDTHADKIKYVNPSPESIHNGRIIAGGSGSMSALIAFTDWVKFGGDYPLDLCRDSTLFVCDASGEVWLYEDHSKPFSVGYTYALGSGCDFAMGAMSAGASAEGAVLISSSLDVYTGGFITILEC